MIKQTRLPLYHHYLILLIAVFGGALNSFSQCPTVTNAIQSFCDIDAPVIANLSATDNGNGIRWYATAISTTPLSNGLGLINGEDYYADDNSGACGSRQRVDVVVYGPPTGLSFQGVCVDDPNEATISDLIATGHNLQWYSVPNGGSPLALSTILTDNTIYYVNQSNPDTGCRTSRLSVFVNVGVVPVPIGSAIQEFCSDLQPPPTIADLQASGTNNWYQTISSASPLDPATPLVDGQSYYATTVDPPCESIERLEVTVFLREPNDSGANGSIDLCETDLTTTVTVNLFDALDGTPETTGIWTGPFPTSNGNLGTVNVTAMTVTDSPYVFNYAVSSDSCETSNSTVSITIIPIPNAGTNGTLDLCETDAPQDLFNSLGGTPETGGTWSPALSSGTGVFDPSVDASGIYTYSVTGTPPCGDASAQVTVTINPIPNPGTNGTLTLCEDDTTIQDLFDSLGGTPDTGGTWSPSLASGTGVFDPSIDAPGTYTYTVTGTPPCGDASATVTVIITPLPDAGTNGTLELCETDPPQDLFNSLGGTPETGGTWSPALSSGTNVFDPAIDTSGIYTYTVTGTPPCSDASATVTVTVNPIPNAGTNGNLTLCEDDTTIQDLFDSLGGTPDTGGTWSPSLASGTGIFDPSIDAPGTYTYTVTGTPPCGDASATVTVIITPLPDAGTNGTLELCETDPPQDLFNSLGGTPESGGTWSPALSSGTGVFDPAVDTSGIYTYTVSGTPLCSDASATVTVTVNPIPNPGTNGTLTLCENDTSTQDLFNSLGGTPDIDGTWSPALSSGTGIFDPTVDAPGTYTYTVAGIPPCGDASATVTVLIIPIPEAGTDGTLSICSNDAPVDLFNSLGGTPDSGGTWSPILASGTGIFDPLIDPSGTYTYTLSGPGFCGEDSAEVIVNIIPEPDSTGLTLAIASICLNDSAGVSISGATALLDGNYSLTYTLSGANSSQTTVVLIIVNGAVVFNIPASLLTNPGTTTFTLSGLTSETTSCGSNVSTIPNVEFNVTQDPTLQLITNGDNFCLEDNPTIADLSNNVLGTNPIIWYDAFEDGTAYSNDTSLIDGTTYYASATIENGCNNALRLAVTVSIESCEELELIIPDGFSPNDDTINDDFLIKNLRELFPDFKLQVYNRYGNILYEGDINTPNWNGRSDKGKKMGDSILPVGVYFFILELNDSTKKTIQGRVYLSM